MLIAALCLLNSSAPDFDISELEKLFSKVNLSSDSENNGGKSG